MLCRIFRCWCTFHCKEEVEVAVFVGVMMVEMGFGLWSTLMTDSTATLRNE